MNQKHRILVVDDEPRNIRLVTRVLSREYDFETASSGEEALEVIPSLRPDLILMDVNMPGLDGCETCRRIRKDKRFKFIKIILVSGNTLTEERLAGYEAGADDYVTKPFEAGELRAKIGVFLKLKRAEEVDQIKGDLLTLFSHETKTPLSGIIGLADLLKSNSALDENTRKCANHIYRSGIQLLEFVRKTSLLCELKSGRELLRTEGLVSEHYANAVGVVEKELPSSNRAEFKSNIPGELCLQVDWEMVDLVLCYLLSNAAKFSPDRSVVITDVQVSDGTCVLSVRNEGEGIDPDWIDKIFDEFAIQDVVHHHQGHGLSLTISRHIVELHGGRIRVLSNPGEGAEFIVDLPGA